MSAQDLRKLEEQVYIVTGAASGIGQAVACRIAAEGGGVVLADIDESGMHETTVAIEKEGAVTTVVLNRFAKRNAMNPLMHREMTEVLSKVERDRELRVLVLTGAACSLSSSTRGPRGDC